MAALQCEICGGKLMAKSGGLFECEYCGMQYDKTRVQEMVQEIKGTVKVEGTVEVKGAVKIEGPVEVKGNTTVKSLLRRMEVCAKNGDYDKIIEELADKVLNIEPECSEAYLWILLAQFRCNSLEELFALPGEVLARIPKSPNWENAVRWCSMPGKPSLEERLKAAMKRAEEKEAYEQAQKDAARAERAVLTKKRYDQIKPVRNLLHIEGRHIIALKANGDVLTAYDDSDLRYSFDYSWMDCVKRWSGVKKLHQECGLVVALRWDGRMLVASSHSDSHPSRPEHIKRITQWENIVDFCYYRGICVGLTASGKLLYSVDDSFVAKAECYCLADSSKKWENVKELYIYSLDMVFVDGVSTKLPNTCVIIGLTEDGRIITPDTSHLPPLVQKAVADLRLDQLDNIREIVCNGYYRMDIIQNDGSLWQESMGAFKKANGKYLNTDIDYDGTYELGYRVKVDNVVEKCVEPKHGALLLMDGSVEECKDTRNGKCLYPVTDPEWKNMVHISLFNYKAILGLREDGAVLMIPYHNYPRRKSLVEGWKLFESLETFEAEREAGKAQFFQNQKNEKLYAEAGKEMKQKKISNIESAKEKFESLGDWKDAPEMAARCEANLGILRKMEVLQEKRNAFEKERASLGFFDLKRKKEIASEIQKLDNELAQLEKELA